MTAFTLQEKVQAYVKLRDYKTAAKKQFDKSMERVNQGMEKLESEILETFHEQGIKNVKTESGTAYLSSRSNVSVKDRDAFEKWADETGNRGAMDIKANAKAIRELLNEGVEEVPGVNYSETVKLNFRRT